MPPLSIRNSIATRARPEASGILKLRRRATSSYQKTLILPIQCTEKNGSRRICYRVHEHLTEDQMAKLLATLKRNRHGHRDWLIGLLIYRHGLSYRQILVTNGVRRQRFEFAI